jgi:hypothetical protein
VIQYYLVCAADIIAELPDALQQLNTINLRHTNIEKKDVFAFLNSSIPSQKSCR